MFWILVYSLILNTQVIVGASNATLDCPDADNKDDVMFRINTMCYHYVEQIDDQVLYSSAEADCQSRSGHLVTIYDNNTQVELVKRLEFLSDSHTVLLGLKKEGNSWRWTTGEALSYHNWDTGSKCSGSCDCAKMKLASNGRWEPFNCDISDWFTVYVCAYDLSDAPSTLYSQPFLIAMCVLFMLIKQLQKDNL